MATAAMAWAVAQDERLTVEVGQCVDLTPEQRLACFDAQVEAARDGAPDAGAPAASGPRAAADVAPAAPQEEPAGFGYRREEERTQREEREDVPPPEDVHATVAQLRETVPNAFLITLDNGQVWRQTRPDPYVSLRVGYDVRIYWSRWRGYRLESPSMLGFMQVERVR